MAGAVIDIARAGLKDIAEWGARQSEGKLTGLIRSGETVLKDTKSGTALLDRFNAFDADVKKEAQYDIDKYGTDPKEAMRLSRNLNMDWHFGPNREFIRDAVRSAAAEKNGVYARSVADIMSTALKESSPKPYRDISTGKMTNWRRAAGITTDSPYIRPTPGGIEEAWKSFSKYVYLWRIAIPHTMQIMNIPLLMDTRAFAKGIFETTSDFASAKLQAQRAGVFADELLHELQGKSKFARIADKFAMPGFSQLRKGQLTLSAMSGKHAALAAAEDLLANPADKAAIKQLQYLGIDPAKVSARGLTQDQLDRAMYQASKEVMYIRTGLEKPHAWAENSIARLMTQYKDFSWNQARVIKMAFRRGWEKEGILGVAKVSAVVGAVFPIAGEFVWSVESLVNRGDWKDRDDAIKAFDNGGGVDNYITALSHMAGLGVAYSIMRAAQRNNLSSYVEGPLLNFLDDETTGLYHGFSKGNFENFYKTNFKKFIPVVGPLVTRTIFPPKRSTP